MSEAQVLAIVLGCSLSIPGGVLIGSAIGEPIAVAVGAILIAVGVLVTYYGQGVLA